MDTLDNQSKRALREMISAFPLQAKIHKATDGGYWVECPDLGGCFSSGDTLKEAIHEFKYAIFEYFDIPKKMQLPDRLQIRATDLPEPENENDSDSVCFVETPGFTYA